MRKDSYLASYLRSPVFGFFGSRRLLPGNFCELGTAITRRVFLTVLSTSLLFGVILGCIHTIETATNIVETESLTGLPETMSLQIVIGMLEQTVDISNIEDDIWRAAFTIFILIIFLPIIVPLVSMPMLVGAILGGGILYVISLAIMTPITFVLKKVQTRLSSKSNSIAAPTPSKFCPRIKWE